MSESGYKLFAVKLEIGNQPYEYQEVNVQTLKQH